jgi:hypothetical protein
MNERAVDSSRSRLLKLQARIPFLAKGDGPEIYIGLRVVNGWLQHWIYGEGTCYTKTRIAVGPEWTDITADLTSSNWWLFQSDGNHIRGWGPNTPDFQIIAGVVLEFGGPGGDRCGPGRATVHIRNVRLIPNTG